MWDLPGPGLEPVSPALASGFPTTVPPGKPPFTLKSVRKIRRINGGGMYRYAIKQGSTMLMVDSTIKWWVYGDSL